MFKISTSFEDSSLRVLKLEGKLLAPWVDEMRQTCRMAQSGVPRLELDLSDLSFADVSGTIALRELVRQGVAIGTTSPFVGELLKEI